MPGAERSRRASYGIEGVLQCPVAPTSIPQHQRGFPRQPLQSIDALACPMAVGVGIPAAIRS